jgi:hypothetical protein
MPVCARGWRQSAEPALGRGLAWPATVGRWPSVLAMWCYCHHGSYALAATATRHATLRATLTLLRYLCHSATMPLLLVPRRAVARLLTMCTWVRPLPCCPHRRFAIFGTMATCVLSVVPARMSPWSRRPHPAKTMSRRAPIFLPSLSSLSHHGRLSHDIKCGRERSPQVTLWCLWRHHQAT